MTTTQSTANAGKGLCARRGRYLRGTSRGTTWPDNAHAPFGLPRPTVIKCAPAACSCATCCPYCNSRFAPIENWAPHPSERCKCVRARTCDGHLDATHTHTHIRRHSYSTYWLARVRPLHAQHLTTSRKWHHRRTACLPTASALFAGRVATPTQLYAATLDSGQQMLAAPASTQTPATHSLYVDMESLCGCTIAIIDRMISVNQQVANRRGKIDVANGEGGLSYRVKDNRHTPGALLFFVDALRRPV